MCEDVVITYFRILSWIDQKNHKKENISQDRSFGVILKSRASWIINNHLQEWQFQLMMRISKNFKSQDEKKKNLSSRAISSLKSCFITLTNFHSALKCNTIFRWMEDNSKCSRLLICKYACTENTLLRTFPSVHQSHRLSLMQCLLNSHLLSRIHCSLPTFKLLPHLPFHPFHQTCSTF